MSVYDYNCHMETITHAQSILTFEREILHKAMQEAHWNQTAAARSVGLTFRQFRYALAKCGLRPDRKKADSFTSAWRFLRHQALRKYGNKCQCCGTTPQAGAVLHVDHIKPKGLHPELALDINNLQILCYDCHAPKGPKSVIDWRP